MQLKPLISLILTIFLLFGCAAKISKSSILYDMQSTDFKKIYSELNKAENFWLQCFNVSEDDVMEKMIYISKQCIEVELRSAPDFLTTSEVEAIKNSAMFCIQLKMWSIYKEKFSLDKNLHDEKMINFCKERWDVYKIYKQF